MESRFLTSRNLNHVKKIILTNAKLKITRIDKMSCIYIRYYNIHSHSIEYSIIGTQNLFLTDSIAFNEDLLYTKAGYHGP